MQTGNAKFDQLLNLIKTTNENNSKIKNKIKFQLEEISKTKTVINQFEECLMQQNKMLNKLVDEKLAIKIYKNDLVKELEKLEKSDDEGCEGNVNNNSANINTINNDCNNTYQNGLNNRRTIGYEINRIDMDNSMEIVYQNRREPIKIDFESIAINGDLLIQSDNDKSMKSNCICPSQNDENSSKRKLITLKAKIKLPKNNISIFKDEDFIKKYSPKLLYRSKKNIVVDMINTPNFLNVICEKGILLKYNKKTNLWTKFFTGNSKKITRYNFANDGVYLICENEFIIFNESKTLVKEFDSNIISNLFRRTKDYPFCHISLENGEIWQYDMKNDKYEKIFSFHSQMKACINLPNHTSLFLTEDGNVFTTNYVNCERIPELDGCVDILQTINEVICFFRNDVVKIYNTGKKTLIELTISENIKFATITSDVRSNLSILDVQNRLHLYKFKGKIFKHNKSQEIQIPTSKNISAISNALKKQIFIIVENEIYLIENI